jgi:hypothetical protein
MSLDMEDRHAAWLAGVEYGIALRCGLDTMAAQHETLHAAMRPIVLDMVSDMNRIMVLDLDGRAQLRRARQVEACEDYKAKARPWPAEVAS